MQPFSGIIKINRFSGLRPFLDEEEESRFKSDVECYTNIRLSQKRPEDKGRDLAFIKSDVAMRINDYWIHTNRNGYIVDFPITDLI